MAVLYVTIDAIDYEVLVDGADQFESEDIGLRKRAIDGTWRSSVKAEKRQWKFSLLFMDNADLATLQTSIARGKIVSCGGPLIGETLDCMVKITDAPFIDEGIDFVRGCIVSISED